MQKLEKVHETHLHSKLSSSWVQLDEECIFNSNEISKRVAYNRDHNILKLLIFFKWDMIIGNKNGIYELPRELMNDLKLCVLRNLKNFKIISKLNWFMALCPVYLQKWKLCQY